MNSQKKIEIHQSSFLSLKAELLRKKQEVRDAKLSNFPNKPTVIKVVKTKLDKANVGVKERDLRDAEEIEEENNVLRKSQCALEAKSKLYDEFVKNPKMAARSGNVLVDFARKEEENDKADAAAEESEEQIFKDDLNGYVDDEEWVDFVDCLGRTKRCHKDDLESMKRSDEKLSLSLFGRSKARERNEDDPRKEVTETEGAKKAEEAKEANAETPQIDLCSDDMRRQMLREKWEEEEKKLEGRRDIHYQHVLFDEARSHGVGYYHFSTDETERARQLKELENLRKETLEQQAATKEAAKRKKKQMDERLRAARRRKRERLGLPPEETEEVEEEEEEPAKPEELKREEQVSSSVRPWDMGKKLNTGVKFYTQEEWIEMKREERKKEFAPPPSFEEPRPKKKKEPIAKSLPEAYLEDISSLPKKTPVQVKREENERETPCEERRGVGAEIPPPPTFEMYGPTSRKTAHFVITSDMEKSVEEGLNIIRRQVEEKQMRNVKCPDSF